MGGSEPIAARVRLIKPSALTKVSAVGIEEQRVNVIVDFADAVESRPSLSDTHRVEAAIVEWESDSALTVLTGSLFRIDCDWAVFVVQQNLAKLISVEQGPCNNHEEEVLKVWKKATV